MRVADEITYVSAYMYYIYNIRGRASGFYDSHKIIYSTICIYGFFHESEEQKKKRKIL